MPTVRPASGPASGPGSASTTGGGAVGSRMRTRVMKSPAVTGRARLIERTLTPMSGTRAEVVCTGVPFGEGPVWCADGTLVVTSVAAGALYRVFPDQHRADRFADTGGGANGAALATDGSILVTQNG